MGSVKSHTILLIQLFNKKEKEKEWYYSLRTEKCRKFIQIYANVTFLPLFCLSDAQ